MLARMIIAAGAVLTASGAAAEDADVKAWIEAEENHGLIEMKSMAETSAPARIHYVLDVERVSESGRSSSSQSGEADIEPGEPVLLSRSAVNAGPDGYLRATLTVTTASGAVEKDEWEYRAR